MQRRKFLVGAGAAGAATLAAQSARAQSGQSFEWRMTTTWPKDFPGLGIGANNLARLIDEMSGGRLKVTVFGGGEIVPALGAFDAVSKGTVEMGHGAAYYWKSKTQAAQFFAAVPFGFNAQELNAWVYQGGGQALWDEIYADFNLKPFLAGNTGVQMGGWFNRKIESIDDFKGLKMRIPGLGGEVLSAIGGTPKLLPGGEIFTSLQSGAIDATEWVGPYNDLAFGFYKIAKHYYYPGWHEPGTGLECFVNRDAFRSLPSDLQAVVTAACETANLDMLSDFMAKNGGALQTLQNEHNVNVLRFPDAALSKLRRVSDEIVAAVADKDAPTKKVYNAYRKFRDGVLPWTALSETPYALARAL